MVSSALIALWCSTVCAHQTSGLPIEHLEDYEAQIRQARLNCGPVSVWRCLLSFGEQVNLGDVLRASDIGERGMDLTALVELCKEFGATARAVRARSNRLAAMPLPSIFGVEARPLHRAGGLRLARRPSPRFRASFRRCCEPLGGGASKNLVRRGHRVPAGRAIAINAPISHLTCRLYHHAGVL